MFVVGAADLQLQIGLDMRLTYKRQKQVTLANFSLQLTVNVQYGLIKCL